MPFEEDSWDDVYKKNRAEELPWFYAKLDPDLRKEIGSMKIMSGKFVDIGTGPGTQAAALSKLGFEVTATDLSKNAIEMAKRFAPGVNLVVDDIARSRLEEGSFDYVFDRGVFHSLWPSERQAYVKNVSRILKKGGVLFLKCFSEKETMRNGPSRFSEKELEAIFSNHFSIKSIRETVFHGTNRPLPKALFAVMRKTQFRNGVIS